MSAARKQTHGATIIPFPNQRNDSQGSSEVFSYMGPNYFSPETDHEFKQLFEGNIADLMVKLLKQEDSSFESPFGSIYLAQLEPDKINVSQIAKIHKFMNITDLSPTIKFDDGWDD